MGEYEKWAEAVDAKFWRVAPWALAVWLVAVVLLVIVLTR